MKKNLPNVPLEFSFYKAEFLPENLRMKTSLLSQSRVESWFAVSDVSQISEDVDHNWLPRYTPTSSRDCLRRRKRSLNLIGMSSSNKSHSRASSDLIFDINSLFQLTWSGPCGEGLPFFKHHSLYLADQEISVKSCIIPIYWKTYLKATIVD